MRILTTSDLSYVGGGDSWGGTPEGQTPYAVAYPGSGQAAQTNAGISDQEAEGLAMAVDNPMGYGIGVIVNLYRCYQNSSSFKGYSPKQLIAAIASGCTN